MPWLGKNIATRTNFLELGQPFGRKAALFLVPRRGAFVVELVLFASVVHKLAQRGIGLESDGDEQITVLALVLFQLVETILPRHPSGGRPPFGTAATAGRGGGDSRIWRRRRSLRRSCTVSVVVAIRNVSHVFGVVVWIGSRRVLALARCFVAIVFIVAVVVVIVRGGGAGDRRSCRSGRRNWQSRYLRVVVVFSLEGDGTAH